MNKNADFIVVIRSSKERTEKLCREIVESEASGEDVIVLQESPFKKTLEECYAVAIQQNTKWLITVDADMLLAPGALQILLQQAENMPDSYVQLQGKILDKITGDVRKAGPRIYRVKYLPKALQISQQSDDHIRPEDHVIRNMGKLGHPSRYISQITCVHDYEQYYSDLYRKAFVHAKKHREFMVKIIDRCVKKMENDPDFRVILKATWDGLTEKGKVSIDSRLYKDKASQALKELNMSEKNSIPSGRDFTETIKKWLENRPEWNRSEMEIHDQPKPDYTFYERFKSITERKGFVKGIVSGIGVILMDFGKKLQFEEPVNSKNG